MIHIYTGDTLEQIDLTLTPLEMYVPFGIVRQNRTDSEVQLDNENAIDLENGLPLGVAISSNVYYKAFRQLKSR